MVAKEIDGSMQWFHFFDAIFLGQWYLGWFLAKSMVLKRFTPITQNKKGTEEEVPTISIKDGRVLFYSTTGLESLDYPNLIGFLGGIVIWLL